MTRKVLELIRVSTDSQATSDRASIPAQRAVNRRTAAAYDLEIIRSIEIKDVSGAAVLLSPEMQELVRLIADTSIHGVVAREFSRLMRPENFSDYALLQAFADSDTILYLPEGPIDFTSKTGRLLGTIRAAIAGMERSEILERVWSAKEEKRRAGKFAQSRICLPFAVGYSEPTGFFYKPEAERVKEAVRLFLAGNTSYRDVAQIVGLNPFTLRSIMRNPILTGWRVIDERRDLRAAARRTKENGRQGDRPKIRRAPEDVIRVKVIAEPLISESEYEQLQAIIAMKRTRHWRTNKTFSPRHTYNGFLTCGRCGEILYTRHSSKVRERSYYGCKKRILSGECEAPYLQTARVESQIDTLFSDRLTDRSFLRDLLDTLEQSSKSNASQVKAERLQAEITTLHGKRARVLDSFYDGLITPAERDRRIAEIDCQIATARQLLFEQQPSVDLTVETLAMLFQPLFEWSYLKRDDKRRLLAAIVPEIKIADYRIYGFYVPLGRNEGILTGKDALIVTRPDRVFFEMVM
jgi:DNA invertase Pin-like site-specific DNA recombinase